MILGKRPTLRTILFYVFISIFYMFQATSCSSPGESIVSGQHLVYVTLCRWPFRVQVSDLTKLTHNSFLCIYFNFLHVSSKFVLIIRRINCINTASGICQSVSVTVSCAGLRPDQIEAQFFSMYLFQFSTCFKQLRAHHQENQLYQYSIWYMSLCVGDRFVCRSPTWPNWRTILFYVFISILYVFQATSCSSSGESIVSIQHLLYVTLCRWPFRAGLR